MSWARITTASFICTTQLSSLCFGENDSELRDSGGDSGLYVYFALVSLSCALHNKFSSSMPHFVIR